MTKRYLSIIVILILNLFVSCVGYTQTKHTVFIVSSSKFAPYQQTFSGFQRLLSKEGIQVTHYYYNEVKGTIKNEVYTRKPDLIFTIGAPATRVVKENISDIPIIFSFIVDPFGKDYISKEEKQSNICGVTLEIPMAKQFETIQTIFSDHKNVNVGVLYSNDKSHKVNEAKQLATNYRLQLIPQKITNSKEVPDALQKLSERIDVLWAIPDVTVFKDAKTILMKSLRNKIPFISFSPQYVKAGSLIALYCDYYDVGEQSAEMAIKIIKHNVSPAELGVQFPRRVQTALNMKIARFLQINIPQEIEDSATIKIT